MKGGISSRDICELATLREQGLLPDWAEDALDIDDGDDLGLGGCNRMGDVHGRRGPTAAHS